MDDACQDHIAVTAMNRPEKLDAVRDEVVRHLMAAFRRFDADVAILFGRGRAFCSGADVHQRQLRPREEFDGLDGPQAMPRVPLTCCSRRRTGSRSSRRCTATSSASARSSTAT